MYAIIKTGSEQLRVKEGDVIDVQLLQGGPGSNVKFNNVLFFFDGSTASVGAPFVPNLSVHGEILSTIAGPKITSVKYIPGNRYKKFGHRQKYTRVKITEIKQA